MLARRAARRILATMLRVPVETDRLALADDALKIVLACQPEYLFPVAVDVVAIEEVFALLGSTARSRSFRSMRGK